MVTEGSRPSAFHALHRVYLWRGWTLVPHYTLPATYVMPGGQLITESLLRAVGASPSTKWLWRRAWGVLNA